VIGKSFDLYEERLPQNRQEACPHMELTTSKHSRTLRIEIPRFTDFGNVAYQALDLQIRGRECQSMVVVQTF